MSTKAGGRDDHLFLFTFVNSFFLDMVFILIFMIYLFIYSKRCQQKQVDDDHLFLFTYANKLFLEMVFIFNIQYLFLYLFKAMSTKAGGSDDLYLLMKMICSQTWLSF